MNATQLTPAEKREADWFGLDERSIRLECLRLAVAIDPDGVIPKAEAFARFVLTGAPADD